LANINIISTLKKNKDRSVRYTDSQINQLRSDQVI